MTTNMSQSTFDAVISGEESQRVFYRDDATIAFLDRNPVTRGHSLVIPKQRTDHLDDCTPEVYTAVFETVQRISKMLKSTFNPERIVLVVHGYEIPHAHVHVIPVYQRGDVTFGKRPAAILSNEQLAEICQLIQGSTDG